MEPGLTPDPGSIQVPQQPSSGDKVAPYGLSGLVTGQRSQPLQPDPGSIQVPLPHGAGTAFARGVATGGTFGASSFLAAAIDTAAQKLLPQRALDYLQRSQPSDVAAINQDIPFSQRRAQYNAANQATQQQHPYAFGAGEVAGAVAVPAPGAGTVTRAAEKAVAAKLGAKAATTAGKVLTKGAGAAAGGAVVGGEFGAGTGLSQGKSAPELAASTLAGAGLGAATGPAAALAGKAVTAAVSKAGQTLADKYTQVFGSEVFGHASKKATQKSWAQILGKEAETGVEQDAAKKFVASPEMAPVEAAARKGKLDDAIAEIDKRLEQYRPGRQANYQALDAADKFEVGKVHDRLFNAWQQAEQGAPKDHTAAKVLKHAYDEWVQDMSSADAGAVQRALLRPEGVESTAVADELRGAVDALPQNGPITRSDLAKVMSKQNLSTEARQYVQKTILDPEQGIMSWNPKAKISALELRAEATNRQKEAQAAFDSLKGSFTERTKSEVKKQIVGGLEDHLDRLAAKNPALKQTVARIRQDDVRFSVLLAAKQGLQEGLEKQQRQAFSDNALKLAGKVLHSHGGALALGGLAQNRAEQAGKDIEEGHYLHAAGNAGIALTAGGAAGHVLAKKLAILANRAQNSQAAQRLYQAIQARLPHGPIGAVTSSNLGQQQPQPQ